MSITTRVRKLQQSEAFARPASLLEQAFRATNQSALRIAGVPYNLASKDDGTQEAIMADVRESFIKKLSLPDLRSLKAELGGILFPNGLPPEYGPCGSVAPVDASTEPPPGAVR